jgi:nicotinate-nucleotide pyrophosphorylase
MDEVVARARKALEEELARHPVRSATTVIMVSPSWDDATFLLKNHGMHAGHEYIAKVFPNRETLSFDVKVLEDILLKLAPSE